MPDFYLGTDTVDSIYLGDQNVCDSYIGTTQAFDNCTYTPVVVTLNVNTGQITGSGYTVGGANTGSSQSGQAGVGTYSFTTTIQADSGWQWDSGPTISPNPNTGTFPSSNTTVTTYISGTVSLIASTTTENTFAIGTVNGPSSGTSISDTSRTGPENQPDPGGNITISLQEDTDYNYTSVSSDAGSMSQNGTTWSVSFSPPNFPSASNSPDPNTYDINASATKKTGDGVMTFVTTGSNYGVTWTSSGGTHSASGTSAGSTSYDEDFGTVISGSITATPSSGYALYSSSTAGGSVTISAASGNDTQITINPQAYEVWNDIYATGPYTQYSDAANCLNYNVNCQSGLNVWYAGGSSGVLGSGPYFTSFSGAPPSPSGALPNGYYIDEDASPRTIFS